MRKKYDPIDKLHILLGGHVGIARALGYTDRRATWIWTRPDKDLRIPFPPEHCVILERATSNEVTRKELRPDDWQKFWPELDGVKT